MRVHQKQFLLPVLLLPVLLLAGGGCSAAGDAKADLIAVSRAGLASVGRSVEARGSVIERYQAEQRKRLDAAFDADTAQAAADGRLTAEYVATARRAYAIGNDALAAQRELSQQVTRTDLGNLSAIDAALARLQQLDAAEHAWLGWLTGDTSAKNVSINNPWARSNAAVGGGPTGATPVGTAVGSTAPAGTSALGDVQFGIPSIHSALGGAR